MSGRKTVDATVPELFTLEQCVHPAHFYRLMEQKREKIPDMLRKNYAPIFLTNLIRDRVCEDSPENSTGSGSVGPGQGRNKKARLDPELDSSDDWTQMTLLENNADFEGTYFLSDGNRTFVEKVLFYAVELRNTNGLGLDMAEFERLFCLEIEFPCLELLWLLDGQFGLMSVTVYLMRQISKPQLDYFVKQFLAFCFSSVLLDEETRIKSTEMLQHFLSCIIKAGYCNPESNKQLVNLKELAIDILIQIRQRLVSVTIESSSYQNLYLLIAVFRTVPVVGMTKRRFFSDGLSRILGLEPEFSMEQILQQQEKIAETGVRNRSLAETISMFIGEPQTKKDVMATLGKNLDNPGKLNWENVLATITVWEEREFTSLRIMSLLRAKVKAIMVVGLTEEKDSHFLAALIIARHCCLICPQKFSRYEEWYTSLFGKELTTLAGNLKTFTFLMKIMTQLVPIEPTCFLQVHATYPPYIPVGGDELWSDYLALAKSRITEYNEVEQAMDYEPNPNPENPIQHDVDTSIKAFDKLKRIPNRINQMLLFEKQYYLESFLPALIKKPLTTAISDARLRLIETLFAAGKIPQRQYKEYKAEQISN